MTPKYRLQGRHLEHSRGGGGKEVWKTKKTGKSGAKNRGSRSIPPFAYAPCLKNCPALSYECQKRKIYFQQEIASSIQKYSLDITET